MNSIDAILLHVRVSHLYDTGVTPESTQAGR